MCVFRCNGTQSHAAGSRKTFTGKSGVPEQALLLSARSPVSPTTFLTSQQMARNAKCAFFVAMALGRARQAAGETLTRKLGLPELAPLLLTQSPISPVASLHQWQDSEFFPQNRQKIIKTISQLYPPNPLLTGLCPSQPPR